MDKNGRSRTAVTEPSKKVGTFEPRAQSVKTGWALCFIATSFDICKPLHLSR
jgi:hypothetical protein